MWAEEVRKLTGSEYWDKEISFLSGEKRAVDAELYPWSVGGELSSFVSYTELTVEAN